MPDVTCEIVASLSAELALGIADGKDRAVAAAHLEQCPACRHRVLEMMDVAEGLVDLIPPAEPPPGFESRVMAAVGSHAAEEAGPVGRRRRRWHMPSLWAVAAVGLAALIAVSGWLVGAAGHASSNTGGVATATLMAGHRPVGQVVVVGGDDPWLSMSVDARLPATRFRCQIREANGTVTTLGVFSVAGQYGYWATALPPSTPIRSAQLVTMSGRVLASGSFPADTPSQT